jgi:hypothetical protein
LLRRLLWSVVLVAALSGPRADAGGTASSEWDRGPSWQAAAIAALVQRGDAASLATAALLSLKHAAGDAAAALELATRASEAAADDPAIGWIHVRVCASVPGCDLRDAATAVRWLDPDNAAAWLPTLAAAQRDKDGTEVDRVLADMAQGERFDFYWNRIVALMYDALKAVSRNLPKNALESDALRLDSVAGLAAGEVMPPLRPLMDACRESSLATERRESCLKIAKSMQQGDTIMTQIAGLELERRFVAPDGREFRTLAERRRTLEWRVANAEQFAAPVLPWLKNAHARWRIARMRSLPREDDVLIAILRAQGMPIDPPEVK